MIRLTLLMLLSASVASADDEAWPRLADERLQLTLFADEAEIVTPIGMAVDPHDAVFVIESHTHHPPSDYDGPAGDRVKRFVDADNDGRPEQVSIFADGLHQAMNLAFSPGGELYVACAREVLRLVDEDGDGVCDRKEQVLKLDTHERYAHNSLLGLTFDRAGWMYVSRGNVGSHAYAVVGSDGTRVEGYGDGGAVTRCTAQGTQVEEFATGFWNPFDLKFDRAGRLLLVDNDPDARGPNRLLQVVARGDYGYKSLHGGGGNHPFQGWDGSLPGTLPFIAGTGEAPSGLIDCRRSSLPSDYGEAVLVAVWNENTIERFDLQPDGGALALVKKSIFMSGPKNFRPVALDCDSRGNLFITDWVLVNYPNHGRGRIWRVSCKTASDRPRPEPYFAPYRHDSTDEQRAAARSEDPVILAEALASVDPFLRHAAQQTLAASKFAELRERWAEHADAGMRLAVLLASKQAGDDANARIRQFLGDPDETVRRAALMWAGESMRPELRPQLESALLVEPVGVTLFETYLAAVQNLDGDFVTAYRNRAARRAKEIPRRLDPRVLTEVARDERYSDEVRGIAVRRFDQAATADQADWLLEQLHAPSDALSMAAMRRLAAVEDGIDALPGALVEIALDEARSPALRSEALLALSGLRVEAPRRLLSLLEDSDADVAVETARTFRAWLDAGAAPDCIDAIARIHLADEVREPLAHARDGALFGDARTQRPTSPEAWRETLEHGGVASRGRRVFFTARVGCAKCHTVDGGGGVLGPDLGRVAQSKSRRRMIDAILDPSAEFPPQYQAWLVVTTDGRIHRGLQLDHQAAGAIVLTTETGETARFASDEIEAYEASPSSLMPSGLAETMSVGEFRDLVAFLESLGE